MSLIARALEAENIPTMVVGSAKDILVAGRPPRAAFVDYPLGHSVGKPFDPTDQLRIVGSALDLFEQITTAGTIATIPAAWDGETDWKQSAASDGGGDSRQPRDNHPQFQLAADRAAAVAAGNLPG